MGVPTPQAEKLYMQDFLVWLPDNRFDYFIEVGQITNGTGAERTITDVIGLPLNFNANAWNLVLNANVANVDAVVVGVTDGAEQSPTIASAGVSADKYFILKKGPAIVALEKLHTSDPAGTAYTMASLVAALEAVGIEVKEGPAETYTQPI